MPNQFRIVDSPVGSLGLVADGAALTGLHFCAGTHPWSPPVDFEASDTDPILAEAARQLEDYFLGKRQSFHLPLSPAGTDFQRAVWDQLRRIPYGQTISYGELARRVGNPNASRAVGLANGKNPIAIIIPCHRVIGANGSLTGFGGGVDLKQALLEHERQPAGASLFAIA